MKRQRNTQQVKEKDKGPPNPTKDEEIGNLPDKEFQIMILKMIQNLENKMEFQINSLETRIEKMQEMFNKDCVLTLDFPGGLDGKASAYNAGDPGSIPGSGRSPGEGNGIPFQYSCPENPMDRAAWQAILHGVAKSQT